MHGWPLACLTRATENLTDHREERVGPADFEILKVLGTGGKLTTDTLFMLAAYGKAYKGAGTVLKRLDEVRMRGRKRSMLG